MIKAEEELDTLDTLDTPPTRDAARGLGADEAADCVQVFVRIRPPSARELAAPGHRRCVRADGGRAVVVEPPDGGGAPRAFGFDAVLPERATQRDVFDAVGRPAVAAVVAGYSATLLAYGQTGAGKSHTMHGAATSVGRDSSGGGDNGGGGGAGDDDGGLAPRIFEALFAAVEREAAARGAAFRVTASMLEVHNERLRDLLLPPPPSAPGGRLAAAANKGLKVSCC